MFYSNDKDARTEDDSSKDVEKLALTDDEEFLTIMETLDDDMDKISVAMVKVSDESKALEFGLDKLPALLYFKNGVPGLYDGSLHSGEKILDWLSSRVTEDNIQLVSDTILEDLIEKVPYVACLFTGTSNHTHVSNHR